MNMNPMMNMNINPMMNMPFLNNDNEISIILQSYIKIKKNDKASALKHYSNFTYNYMPILFDKTFEENGIQNGSIINITNKIYNLVFDYNKTKITLVLGGDCPFKQAIYLYSQHHPNLYQKILNKAIRFIRNNINLNFDDGTPLNKLFQNDGVNLSILVFETKGIIGG